MEFGDDLVIASVDIDAADVKPRGKLADFKVSS
jgi:hypothetical protein